MPRAKWKVTLEKLPWFTRSTIEVESAATATPEQVANAVQKELWKAGNDKMVLYAIRMS